MKYLIAALLLYVVIFASYELAAQERKGLDEQRISELRNMVENTRLDLTPLLKYAKRPPSDGMAKTFPAQFSWQNISGEDWMSPVRDQDGCGSCWTFGTLAALEAAMNIYLDDSEFDYDLSEQHMVSCGAGSCDDGGMAEEVLQYLLNSGIPDEACFPYEAEELSCSLTCGDWQSRAVKISDWGLMLNPTEQELKTELLNGPLAVTMRITAGFYGYSGGVYVGSSETCSILSNPPNHVVALVGWDDSDNTWIAKNSWNTDWGIDGYIKIRRGTDCFASVSADWLRVDPPTIPGIEGDAALCITPAILNIEVPEGQESEPIPVTLENCGDFNTDWNMDVSPTWTYWIYPAPYQGTLNVDQSVTVNIVVDAEQKEAGDTASVQLKFNPTLSGLSANIVLNIAITENVPVDGDEPPADEDENSTDGDIDIEEELDADVSLDNDIENADVHEAEIIADGDAFEGADGREDADESFVYGDADISNTEEGVESESDPPSNGDEEPARQDQSISSSGGCGMQNTPQGMIFIFLCAFMLAIRRRSVH